MIELVLIGMGTGSSEHFTLQAIRALQSADLVLIPRKGADKAELLDARLTICSQFLSDLGHVVEFDLPVRDAGGSYLDGVSDWHDAIAAVWARLIKRHRPQGLGRVALLVWGDPSLYDSSLRIGERLQRSGVIGRACVIPGLTSLQLLTAAFAIPLNTVGGSVHLTTGRRLRDDGWPAGVDTVAVFLDGACAFADLPPDDLHIYWGAYLGMAQQTCVEGALAETKDQIIATRRSLRERHGWIMDVYLLRRLEHEGRRP